MRSRATILLLVLLATHPVASLFAQSGSIQVATVILKLEANKPKTYLPRKRFYLLKGGLADNAALLGRLEKSEVRSRDCYYSDVKASPQFICWLKAENCESPYCRKIKADEVQTVPEFQAAYTANTKKPGFTPAIALDWLTTSLPPIFSNGFYEDRRKVTETLLGGVVPLQSTMTDSKGALATLIDISTPSGAKPIFLVSNVLPIEIGAKSYVWACEADLASGKAKINLPAAPNSKCRIFVRDVKTCSAAACPAK